MDPTSVSSDPPDATPSTPPALPASTATKNEHSMGMLCHLAALSGYIGVPFGHILGPLIMWLIKREEMPFVESQGKESLNFQISMTIYMIAAGLLCLVLIGIPILIGLAITDFVFVIVAAIKTSSGQSYQYPMTIRFIQ